ncbi:hypothetical protein C8J56DRAFT_1057339 [Mycena floridula]|nr:hypothetical protein C8J56DRAFT_1057339 [Mycena floridula]
MRPIAPESLAVSTSQSNSRNLDTMFSASFISLAMAASALASALTTRLPLTTTTTSPIAIPTGPAAPPAFNITGLGVNASLQVLAVLPEFLLSLLCRPIELFKRGFYQLDTKVKALHDAIYYFQGQIVQAEATSTLLGPVDGANYVYRDEFDLTPTIYSPCGEDTVLNINTQVRVDNSGNTKGFGYVTDDSIDASITQTLNFQWLTC